MYFYRWATVECGLLRLREVYKREMSNTSDLFVYESQVQRMRFKAVVRKKQQTVRRLKIKEEEFNRRIEGGVDEDNPSCKRRDRSSIKYDEIMRAIVAVQRAFRRRRE